jgi:hypothetical protein
MAHPAVSTGKSRWFSSWLPRGREHQTRAGPLVSAEGWKSNNAVRRSPLRGGGRGRETDTRGLAGHISRLCVHGASRPGQRLWRRTGRRFWARGLMGRWNLFFLSLAKGKGPPSLGGHHLPLRRLSILGQARSGRPWRACTRHLPRDRECPEGRTDCHLMVCWSVVCPHRTKPARPLHLSNNGSLWLARSW